ncbi:MAG: hypothetical protein ACI4PI_03545 [Oscillospiraceae bacterium]
MIKKGGKNNEDAVWRFCVFRKSYKIEFNIYSKNINVVCVPDVGSFAQNIGKSARSVRGESVLIGEDAIDEFERLVALFDLNQESKLLILPNGEMFFSYFSKLEMNGNGKHKKNKLFL